MLDQLISYAFPLLELACGIAIVLRFRGSPGAVLGGIAFGVFVATSVTRRVLGALDVEWWEYNIWFTLANLAAYGCLLAALMTGRVHDQVLGAAMGGGEGTSEQIDTGAPTQVVSIGGWLILPAIGLVLGPIVSVVTLVVSLALFSDVADAGYGGLFALEVLVQLGLLVLLLYTAFRFFGKTRNAPSAIIRLIIASVVASGLLLLVGIGAGAEGFAIESAKALARGIVSAVIWIPYFKVSKRVKATFVH